MTQPEDPASFLRIAKNKSYTKKGNTLLDEKDRIHGVVFKG